MQPNSWGVDSVAQEQRKGPFKVMNPLTWVPDPERTERILRGMPDSEDQKGGSRERRTEGSR